MRSRRTEWPIALHTVGTSLATLCMALVCVLANSQQVTAADPPVIQVWPGMAPGESSEDTGTALPTRPNESKPILRVSGVRKPTLDCYPAANNPTGTAVIILPGGGFGYVVPNLEGSEAAEWLNKIGISAFVLRYRTKEAAKQGEPLWQRPLEDAQRAVRLLRSQSAQWKIDPARIGVLGFSAGGQVAAVAHARGAKASYEAIDEVDKQSCRPAFSLLIYPWQVADKSTGELLEPIQMQSDSPPAFIVHTHDDASSSVGAAKIYIALKEKNVPAELHVYQTGGHGYGVRERPGSVISTWPDRATDWLRIGGWIR